MNTEKIDIISGDRQIGINKAADILKHGGIVAIPTETVYGLAASAFDDEAIKKVFIAKGRPQNNPLIVHIDAMKMLDAVAYDIDEWSTRNTLENAELNGVKDRIEVLCGDVHVLSHIEGIFDVVVANINRNVLLADLPYYCEVLAQDGIIILSGFYEADAELLREDAAGLGLHEAFPPRTEGEWCCLTFRR